MVSEPGPVQQEIACQRQQLLLVFTEKIGSSGRWYLPHEDCGTENKVLLHLLKHVKPMAS